MEKKNFPIFMMGVLSAGLTRACDDGLNIGGVKSLWVANRDEITSLTPGTAGAAHTYTAAVMVTDKVFYEIQPLFDTIKPTFKEVAKGKTAPYTETNIEFQIPNFGAANILFIENLRKSCGLIFGINYMNGANMVYGYDEKVKTYGALFLSEIDGDSGTDVSGNQLITVKLMGKQIETPYNSTIDYSDV